jgi:MFS family permease
VRGLTRSPLWRNYDFVHLWGASTISLVGSQITLVALPLTAVIVLDASAFQVALLTTFDFLPYLLFALPAGVWIDRLARRAVLVATDAGRAALLASIPLAYAFDALTLGHLYAVGFAVGILSVFFELAYTSYLPALVQRSQLVAANSKLELSRSATLIAGPGLAGGLIRLLSAPGAIAFDALSFLASGLLVLRIRRPERRAAADTRRHMRRELVEGVRFVVGQKYLLPVAAATAITNLFWNAAFAVYFVFAARELDLGAGTIGLVLTLGNIGWLAGAAVAERATERLGVGATLTATTLLHAPAWAFMAVAPASGPIPALVAAWAITSFAAVVFNITTVSLRQSVTPDALQGRTVGALRTVVWGAAPLGALLGGLLASAFDLRATFWIAAAGSAVAVVPIVLSSARSLRRMPGPDPEPEPVT